MAGFLLVGSPAIATTWTMSTTSGQTLTLDVIRTRTGYKATLHEASEIWLPMWNARHCPGEGRLPAGTTMLQLTRQTDGTFDVWLLNGRLYQIGPNGLGTAPAQQCIIETLSYRGQLVDRATVAADDRDHQLARYDNTHDTFLVLQPTSPPCPVPEERKHTCGGQFPFKPIIDAPLVDSDNDGLMDEWEINGLRKNGQTLDLKGMGADPDHKDLFVQIDSAPGTELSPAVLDAIAADLERIPVVNPDGRPGITLHADAGPNSKIDRSSGRAWGSASRAHPALSVTDHFSSFRSGPCPAQNDLDPAPFDDLRARNVEQIRTGIFRYVLLVKYLGPTTDCSSGNAFDIPSNGFVMADWVNNHVLSDSAREGTFLHELGHSIGLMHGGNEDDNNKPNYQSVMNYLYQMTGIPRATAGLGDYTYSSADPSSTNEIDERHIDESHGFPAVVPSGKILYDCRGRTKGIRVGRRVDMNCDGRVTTRPEPVDLTSDNHAGAKVLSTHNDARAIRLVVPTTNASGSGAGAHPQPEPKISEALDDLGSALGDTQRPTVRLRLRTQSAGRVVVVTAHDDIGLGAAVVTSGSTNRVVMLAAPGAMVRDATVTVDVDATGTVSVDVTDLAGKSATATAH